MATLYEELPVGWKQICTKPHHGKEDHNSRCANWICPAGLTYKTWYDVQAYFQLLSFEEDIPGVECRPENARRASLKEEEVTLEEATKKDYEEREKAKILAQKSAPVSVKRVKKETSNEEPPEKKSAENEKDQEPKKRGRRKGKNDDDEDFNPDVVPVKTETKSPKKTRRTTVTSSSDKGATLDENPQVVKIVDVAKSVKLEGSKEIKTPVTANKNVKISKVESKPSSPEVVKIDEVKKAPDESTPKATSQKLYDSRWEVFKEHCSKIKPKPVEPINAPPSIIEDFLKKLAEEKNVGKAVLSSYKSAIVKTQSDLKSKQTQSGVKAEVPIKDKKSNVSSPKTNEPVKQVIKVQETPKVQQTRSSVSVTPVTPAGRSKTPSSNKDEKNSAKQSPSVGISTTTPQASKSADTPINSSKVSATKTSTPKPGGSANISSSPSVQGIQQTSSNKTNVKATTSESKPLVSTPQGSKPSVAPKKPEVITVGAPSKTATATPSVRAQTVIKSVAESPAAKKTTSVTQQVGTPGSSGVKGSGTVRPVVSQSQAAGARPQGVPLATGVKTAPPQQGVKAQGQPQPSGKAAAPSSQATPPVQGGKPGAVVPGKQTAVTPANTQSRPAAPAKTGSASPAPLQYAALPSFLAPHVSFPCKLIVNSGGGPSLYRCAAQHAGFPQEMFKELRRYCHTKLLEWFQWYEPYYTFPLQLSIRINNKTVPRNISSSQEFQKFLNTEESLFAFHVNQCELYCLANVLGVPLYLLTYNIAGMSGRPEERCRWDTLDPHHSLVHKNKFTSNKDPLYLLYEDKVHFSKMIQTK